MAVAFLVGACGGSHPSPRGSSSDTTDASTPRPTGSFGDGLVSANASSDAKYPQVVCRFKDADGKFKECRFKEAACSKCSECTVGGTFDGCYTETVDPKAGSTANRVEVDKYLAVCRVPTDTSNHEHCVAQCNEKDSARGKCATECHDDKGCKEMCAGTCGPLDGCLSACNGADNHAALTAAQVQGQLCLHAEGPPARGSCSQTCYTWCNTWVKSHHDACIAACPGSDKGCRDMCEGNCGADGCLRGCNGMKDCPGQPRSDTDRDHGGGHN